MFDWRAYGAGAASGGGERNAKLAQPLGGNQKGTSPGGPKQPFGTCPAEPLSSWMVSQRHGATPIHVWVGSELLEPKELTLLPSYRAPAPATAAWGQPQQPPSIGAAPGWPTSFVLPSRAGDLFAFLLAAAGSPSAKKPPRMLNPGLEAVDS